MIFFETSSLYVDRKSTSSAIPLFLNEGSWEGKTFQTLDTEIKEIFLKTKLNFAIIKSEDLDEIRDLFVRLQAGLPLNAQEKRDAWPGDFTNYIINTAGKQDTIGHPFFKMIVGVTEGKGKFAHNYS